MTNDLLIEIGTEEIPAGFIPSALESFSATVKDALRRLRLSHGQVRPLGTPRRLAILVEEVASQQSDLEEEVIGPPYSIAFDEEGNPTAAAKGFARSQGVSVSQLRTTQTSKGTYVMVKKVQKGRLAMEVLPSEIPGWIEAIPFPKSMRWGDGELRFARPIHWLVAMLGEEVIPCSIAGIRSGRTTRGHRFLSPQEVEIQNPGAYIGLCRGLHVLVDPEERRKVLLEEARSAAEGISARLVEDPELVEIVLNLVEYPVAVVGRFDPAFLELPREVLITAMREHQRFFSLEDSQGRLMPHFVNIANIRTDSMDLIREGNERVLRARLSDARFFFREDRKRPLAERVQDLEGVIFHSKLGSSLEKVERIRKLSRLMAQRIAPELVHKVDRAATLCKADLTTEMVGEFPSLQGVMGREYALLDGEDPEVAQAIQEHYLPMGAGDRLPSTLIGSLVSLADKTDTLVGCFGVGEVPTGAGDPLGLRRAALGILSILLERPMGLTLSWMVRRALEGVSSCIQRPSEEVQEEVLNFFRVRLANLWTSQGHAAETVEAVLEAGFDDPREAWSRLQALDAFMKEEGFEDLALSCKRVFNIVKDAPAGEVDPSRFESEEERSLFEAGRKAEKEIHTLLEEGKPLEALYVLASLRPRIDAFFDAVMVLVEDPVLRENRLRLLVQVAGLFRRMADLSKISAKP